MITWVFNNLKAENGSLKNADSKCFDFFSGLLEPNHPRILRRNVLLGQFTAGLDDFTVARIQETVTLAASLQFLPPGAINDSRVTNIASLPESIGFGLVSMA